MSNVALVGNDGKGYCQESPLCEQAPLERRAENNMATASRGKNF